MNGSVHAVPEIPPLLRRVLDAPAGYLYRIVIVISSPVDPGCVGSALTLQWLFGQQHSSAIISFAPIPERLSRFPGIDQVQSVADGGTDLAAADVLVLVDGSSWAQFFGADCQTLLGSVERQRIVNIDHHQPGDIVADIPGQCVCMVTSSTAQVIYETCLYPRGIALPPFVADVLYRALLYDTRVFRNEMYPGLYAFAGGKWNSWHGPSSRRFFCLICA